MWWSILITLKNLILQSHPGKGEFCFYCMQHFLKWYGTKTQNNTQLVPENILFRNVVHRFKRGKGVLRHRLLYIEKYKLIWHSFMLLSNYISTTQCCNCKLYREKNTINKIAQHNCSYCKSKVTTWVHSSTYDVQSLEACMQISTHIMVTKTFAKKFS